jgi:ribosomal protein S18 acetylase RimI-like enzyme
VAAYRALPGPPLSLSYAEALADVARRAAGAQVLVAVDGTKNEGSPGLQGCVTLVPDARSPYAELLDEGEAGVRMLAVHPRAQRRGVGRALLRACIGRALALGRSGMLLHSTPWMRAAHRLYESEGFVRVPERDWYPGEVELLAFWLELGQPRLP